jgi:reductive dehalogenase
MAKSTNPRPGPVSLGASRYVVGEAKPFDQKNQMIIRSTWDAEHLPAARLYFGYHQPLETPGFTLREEALNDASWWIDLQFGSDQFTGGKGLHAWEAEQYSSHRVTRGMKLDGASPIEMTRLVKKTAKFFGASLVGICRLDRRWIYSHSYHTLSKEHKPIEIPPEFEFAVVMAHEMRYDAIQQAPNLIGSAAAASVYSRMAGITGLVAQFIRGLGFRAIPCGNDTAASIPLAIDAGIGQISRGCWLLTPEFGPRVRISKLFTDMPLLPDRPREFGAWDFCLVCKKCARHCPSRAISDSSPSTKTLSFSNRTGILRWTLDTEKCYTYQAKSRTDCAVCMRVCPFNKKPGPLHSTVKWCVRNLRFLDPVFVGADDLFGYGKPSRPSDFWES